MSLLALVRHGQARLDSDDYDQLSPLGEQQATALGRHWAALGTVPDRVVIGPCRRHRQTHDAVAAEMTRHGLPWPEPSTSPALDEHQGPAVLRHHAPRIEAEMASKPAPPGGDESPMQAYMRLFRHGSRAWVRGDLPTPAGHEDWTAFRQRVAAGLSTIAAASTTSAQVEKPMIAAFTSGGSIAAAVGYALGLSDEAVLELSWVVRNTSVTTLRFRSPHAESASHFGLVDFNSLPFAEPRLMTFV